ncbi:MAG: PaaI family thioesterase, partial [Spirochaetaceae bacterium]|nr:PaaI family thioesterase [Spirochaetaceae bacterium]
MKYAVAGKQPNSRMCAVCGKDNAGGMHAEFFNLENGEAAAFFTPTELHQGYPDRLHGGFATAILDELIGRAYNTTGDDIWSVTIDISVKFRKPVPLGKRLTAVGRVTKRGGRIFEGTGEILLEDGSVAVEASARYMKIPFDTPAA